MHGQNSPAEQADAILSMVSRPIRSQLSARREGQLFEAVSDWQSVHVEMPFFADVAASGSKSAEARAAKGLETYSRTGAFSS